jgi:hypothetical protein
MEILIKTAVAVGALVLIMAFLYWLGRKMDN